MKITIDIDVLENILKHHNNRNKNQTGIFSLILGKQLGPHNIHITDVIYQFFTYKEDTDKVNDLVRTYSK